MEGSGSYPAVLVVEHKLYEDGAGRSTVRLVDRWRRAGSDVTLYVLERTRAGEPAATLPTGLVPVHPTRHRELRLRWTLLWGLLRLVLLARRADVVVSGREIGWGLLLARAATLLARRPLVVMIRSEPLAAIEHYVDRPRRPLVRAALRSADRLVCISPGLVPAVRALGVPEVKISVVLNGVDVAAIRGAADPLRAQLPVGDGPLVVGVGRLAHQKGFDLLVQAHARVVAAGVPHRLLLLGDGPQAGALAELAERLGVAGSVHLPGFTHDPLPVVAAADLFCLPSRWEGFGQTLAEAMIASTPVVAADCVSGPRHLLADGAFGDLVPVEDVTALAAAVERHLRQPTRLAVAAQAGHAWAVSHLDVARTAEQVMAVLADVAGRRTQQR